MSDYKKITRHPNTGKYYEAKWHDDYFGDHRYGVSFPDDPVVYPADQVRQAQLQTFWAADVLAALAYMDVSVLDFLKFLDGQYKARWKRDPAGGEGAVDWLSQIRGDES